MRTIAEILQNTDARFLTGCNNIIVSGLSSSSRDIEAGFIFFALKGVKTDGHQYIDNAIEKGAVVVVCSQVPENLQPNITYFQTNNNSETYAMAAANWFGNPSHHLSLVGITGTNGKTTTATLLYNLFNRLGHSSGLISTIRYIFPGNEIPATHTTPDAIVLNRILSEMVEAGCTHCFMEVSSHAIVQGRIHGLRFAGGVFTNLTHDHLDYHGTFSEYLKAKQMFFDNLPTKTFALTNVDDTNGNVMVQNTKATISTYAINRPANFKTRILQNSITGLGLNIDGTEAWFRLVGRFNAYNITAIFATAVLCGLDKNEVLRELSGLAEVDGRFNVIRSSNNITGIVDYAHTPDALSNVLTTIAEVNDGNGRIITVAGAGGDRDKSKRPVMGQIMAKYSQLAIITSDNPRSEDPETIIAEIKSGIDITEIKKVLCIADRREAIRTACMMALPGDIVLIAGKGHETYQEVNGVKTHFNDAEILSESLNV